MYSYLTGSASWFILTLLTESFGVKADMGDLVISPKLVKEQFKTSNQISVQLNFARKKIKISYLNPHKKDYPHYKIKQIKTNIPCQKLQDTKILIKRESLVSYPSQELNINIILD
jgi:cellobiose phosphorylase